MLQTSLGIVFKLFSVAFEPPTLPLAQAVTSGSLQRDMKTVWDDLELDDKAITEFINAISVYKDRDSDDVLHELRRETTRIFLGDKPLIANSEGMWRMRFEGRQAVLIINSYSLEVAQFMRKCGVVKTEKYNDCIDYIELECDFASILAENPQYLIELDKDPGQLLSDFIDNHMKLWIPGFCSDVQNTSRVVYYQALCKLMNEFVEAL